MSTQVVSGQANIPELLKHTALHPKGRLQLNPETGEVNAPHSNTDGTFINKVNRGGIEETITVPRQVGHATWDGIWRTSFSVPYMDLGFGKIRGSCPQELYHNMVIAQDQRKALGKDATFVPELTDDELKSYIQWKVTTEKILSPAEDSHARAFGILPTVADTTTITSAPVEQIEPKIETPVEPPKRRFGRPKKVVEVPLA